MSENEQLIWALEEHDKKYPVVTRGEPVPFWKDLEPQRGSHALRDQDRERRELAVAREKIEQVKNSAVRDFRTTQEPYKSREEIANKKIKGATGILAEIRARRKGFADIFEEKEGKK
jgi:hypothetical protein